MMVSMCVVITQYPSVVAGKYQWIDISKAVTRDSSLGVPPDLFLDERKRLRTAKVGQ
jgi:hypothetical protein